MAGAPGCYPDPYDARSDITGTGPHGTGLGMPIGVEGSGSIFAQTQTAQQLTFSEVLATDLIRSDEGNL